MSNIFVRPVESSIPQWPDTEQTRQYEEPSQLVSEDQPASDTDEEPEAASAEAREKERIRVLEAAGVLSRVPTRRRKAPAPPRQPSVDEVPDTSPVYSEFEVQQDTEDAYDRWVALQRELPQLPPVV